MKILVTGGAGFLGSHLCDRLINQGHDVKCMDNLHTGSKENIKHHFENPRFKFIKHDVVDSFNAEVDQIYNLACPASPVHYQTNPIKTFKTSIMGALNTLNLAKEGVTILQASTSEVYGDPEISPQAENYKGNVNPIGPRACYDEGKRGAESLFFDYYRQKNTDIRVMRIFNTYGPRMMIEDGRVVSNFIVQAINNKDITVYGDGRQTRSFCYVDDLIDGMIRFMNQKDTMGPMNIGNEKEFTVMELANLIIKLTGSKSKIIHKELPIDDPIQRKPDCKLAKKILDWEAQVSLKEGLLNTINYFK